MSWIKDWEVIEESTENQLTSGQQQIEEGIASAAKHVSRFCIAAGVTSVVLAVSCGLTPLALTAPLWLRFFNGGRGQQEHSNHLRCVIKA